MRIYHCASRRRMPSVLLESASLSPKRGRYSLIATRPFLAMESRASRITLRLYGPDRLSFPAQTIQGDPFEILRRLLKLFAFDAPQPWPPFAGGAVGYVGYEAKNLIEPRLPQRPKDDPGLPELYFLFFSEGIIADHGSGDLAPDHPTLYLFTHVPLGKNSRQARQKAERRLEAMEKELGRSLVHAVLPAARAGRPAPRHFFPWDGIESSVSRGEFVRQVKTVKRSIQKGDIFQANLSQRFSFQLPGEPLAVYERLRSINPSAFFGFLDACDFQIICGSPERLVKLEEGILETRPIAGTRPRGASPEEDEALTMELVLNEKERAEHLMLVDLERNDLGRVSEYGSVCVDEWMAVENYSHVKHIVSNVRSVLREGLDAVDALKALFPGGTITGAPKIRCMEILDELEPVARGPYTGSLGYFSFTGNMDFNIIIRSLVVRGQTAHLHVGAGIVADSSPEEEYDETLHKAKAVLNAVFGEEDTGDFLRRCGASAVVSG